MLDIPENLVLRRGKLGAGEMIYLDLEKHRILFDKEIKTLVARAKPYRRWVDDNRITLSGIL